MFFIFDIILKITVAFKHAQAQHIIEKVEYPEERTLLIGYHPRIPQYVGTIEIYCNIYHERDTMYCRALLSLEMPKKIY